MHLLPYLETSHLSSHWSSLTLFFPPPNQLCLTIIPFNIEHKVIDFPFNGCSAWLFILSYKEPTMTI